MRGVPVTIDHHHIPGFNQAILPGRNDVAPRFLFHAEENQPLVSRSCFGQLGNDR